MVRLGELAANISRHPLLGKVLALKGGTALNLGHDEPTRLSVDLDYNYIGHLEKGAMLDARPQVEQAVEALARGLGYRIQRSADAHAGRKIYLGYNSALGPPDRVEIDLNYLFRIPAGALRDLALWQPGGLDRPVVLAVSLKELLAGKINALLDRTAVRDVWDVSRFPATEPDTLTSADFRAWFMAISTVLPQPLTKYGRGRLEARATTAQIEDRLLPLLARGMEAQPDELVEKAWRVVSPLLALRPNELEFVQGLQKGNLEPTLLFPDHPEMVGLVAGHPAILWRLQNIRRHLSSLE